MFQFLKQAAARLKADTLALYFATRHPATPWYARLLVALVVAYAFSPIDLIPDFIPVLGFLDDIVLLPLGIALALRLIPPTVMADCRTQAQAAMDRPRPVSRVTAVVVVLIWAGLALLTGLWLVDVLGSAPPEPASTG